MNAIHLTVKLFQILCFMLVNGYLCSAVEHPNLLATESLISTDGVDDIRTLKIGETLSLNEIGPVIINADGTTRRISNWDKMSPQEQQSAWKLIGARNRKRLEKLKNSSPSFTEKMAEKDQEILAIGDGSVLET